MLIRGREYAKGAGLSQQLLMQGQLAEPQSTSASAAATLLRATGVDFGMGLPVL